MVDVDGGMEEELRDEEKRLWYELGEMAV